MNVSNQRYKRISFASDEHLSDLLNQSAAGLKITKSLLIRSVLMSYLQKNHSNLIGSIL
jgi:hypothetical protein